MRVGPVHAPRGKDPLHQAVVTGPADVVHDLVVAAFLERPPDAPADVGQGLRPRDAGPAALAAPADALQGIEDPVRIVDLVQRRGTLGAVTPAAAGVRRVAFELANLQGLFVHPAE